jgi:sterol desaturase/sphingolipid hydroxylase (fatty acid hydroxylase superfamily)
MLMLWQTIDTIQSRAIGWIIVLGVLTGFELLHPHGRQSIRSRVNGVAFWALSIPLSAVVLVVFTAIWARLGIRPLFTLPSPEHLWWAGPIAGLAAIVTTAVVHDFFFYWYHRAQHRWLWRFHAVHHSIRDLNAVNSYHHASEAIVSLVLNTIPVSLLVADPSSALPFVALALWLHVVWIHSPTRAHLGPLRVVLADNRFHRIHHSLEERHFDRNFGAFTTLWDRLFGTAHFPERDEWPDVGLKDVREPAGVREWFDLPSRYAVTSGSANDGAAGSRVETAAEPVRAR